MATIYRCDRCAHETHARKGTAMTMAEINTHLENVDSWELAPREAIDAFEKEMADKQYGRSACLNAWLWFYTGWCAR